MFVRFRARRLLRMAVERLRCPSQRQQTRGRHVFIFNSEKYYLTKVEFYLEVCCYAEFQDRTFSL
jgi:hypothetical protein